MLLGTAVYSIHEGWNVVDAFYFAVCTLTTSSIADPNLMLRGGAIKMFTSFYILIGIGVLVELVRQIGFGYVAIRSDHNTARHKRDSTSDPPAMPPSPGAQASAAAATTSRTGDRLLPVSGGRRLRLSR
ncbi:MAG: ion channel [Solirubrobacteraceae bacterium]